MYKEKKNRIRVGVLMGGQSIEQEVSLNSGRTVCDHLDTHRYDVVPLFEQKNRDLFILPWRFLHRGKISDFQHRLATEAQHIVWDDLRNLVDLVYIAQHGRYGEDGRMQGLFEVLQIPYIGSKILTSAIGMNKVVQKKILQAAGIVVPRDVTVTPSRLHCITEEILCAELADADIPFPVIVKPHQEGSSLGISVVHTPDRLIDAVHHAASISDSVVQSVLIEEKLVGMEFTCITVTDYRSGDLVAFPLTEIVYEQGAEFYTYDQKYMPGRAMRYTPARCSLHVQEQVQQICKRVMQILEITNMSRIDGMVTSDGRIVIFDPNTFSGMAPSSFVFKQAAQVGMNHTMIINHLIETELHQINGGLTMIEEKDRGIQQELDKKIKIGVLFGGNSNEKEISLESGRNVIYKLSPHVYDTLALFVSHSMRLYKIDSKLLVSSSTAEIEAQVTPDMELLWADLSHYVDFVFIALHGGHGENGGVQGMLEILGIAYNGSSVLTSALCMNKFKTNTVLRNAGIAVPDSLLVEKKEWQSNKENVINEIQQRFSFPLIVKPHDDGCSVYVGKAKTIDETIEHITMMFSKGKICAMIEELIVGMELTVGVLGNDNPRILPPSQAVATDGVLSIEEKFLPGAGENQTPAPLSPYAVTFVQEEIKKTYQLLGCRGYARIDCFYQSAIESPTGKERCVILEINTLPGLTPATCIFHQAAEIGIRPMDFIDAIVKLGLEEHVKQRDFDSHTQILY
jgi:UDP-N-acetylmuramate--alanine ligase